jgi:hypothetical protein
MLCIFKSFEPAKTLAESPQYPNKMLDRGHKTLSSGWPRIGHHFSVLLTLTQKISQGNRQVFVEMRHMKDAN